MKTSETLAEFVLVGVLAFFAAYRVAAALGLHIASSQQFATGLLGDGVYFAVFLALAYLAGLIINAICKELLRAQDRWIRSSELEKYASSARFRSLINSLELGIHDYECVDPLETIHPLRRIVLSLTGLTLGHAGARRNAKRLEKRYRVVGQLPFAMMKESAAAHADISVQRATVRVSRNSFLIFFCASIILLLKEVVERNLSKESLLFAAAAGAAYISFRQRARWYALDSIKYALTDPRLPRSKMPKGVLIDQGGVLTADIREPFFKALEIRWPALRGIISDIDHILWREASTSIMSYEKFWTRLREEIRKRRPGIDISRLQDAELKAMARREFKLNAAMLQLINELRELNVPVVLVTNNTSFWMEGVNEIFQYTKIFSSVVASFRLGVAKPDRLIFMEAIKSIGVVEPESLVFIDDREENCLAAGGLGLRPVLYRNTQRLSETLRGFGFPIEDVDRADQWISPPILAHDR